MTTRPRLVDRPDPDESMAPIPDISILSKENPEPEVLPPRQIGKKAGYSEWSEKNLPQDKPQLR